MSIGCYHRLPRAAQQSYKFTSLVYKTPTTLVLYFSAFTIPSVELVVLVAKVFV